MKLLRSSSNNLEGGAASVITSSIFSFLLLTESHQLCVLKLCIWSCFPDLGEQTEF